MKTPEFWADDGRLSRLLSPLSGVWAWHMARRLRQARSVRAGIPVVCIGNVVAGGAGKTPVALAVAQHLQQQGMTPHFLSRGYGGRVRGPVRVDPQQHSFHDVGDEPLLLAQVAPTWVSRNRPAGAQAAQAAGADVLVMDDGFQNPSLYKDISILVLDGAYGIGNGRVLPAGPCRESLDRAVMRAQAVVIMGDDRHDLGRQVHPLPVARAQLKPGPELAQLQGQRVIAFAGLGRPQKFFDMLRDYGVEVVAAQAFADHHPYDAKDTAALLALAQQNSAVLVTTAKDSVRLPIDFRRHCIIVTVALEWGDLRPLLPCLQQLGLAE